MYGENFKQEDDTTGSQKTSATSNKRKAVADNATKEYANYDWPKLADNGQVYILVPKMLYSSIRKWRFIKIVFTFAVEGVDSVGTEALPERTQPAGRWQEGGSDQQDLDSHG